MSAFTDAIADKSGVLADVGCGIDAQVSFLVSSVPKESYSALHRNSLLGFKYFGLEPKEGDSPALRANHLLWVLYLIAPSYLLDFGQS